MNWRSISLKLVLASACIFNLVLGVIAYTSAPLVLKVADVLYGAQLNALEEHTIYILKILGCFLIAMAVMTAFAIKDPIKNKVVVYGNIIWLVMRGIQRVMYVEAFHQDWGIPYAKLWTQAVFVFLVAIALFLLLPKESKA